MRPACAVDLAEINAIFNQAVQHSVAAFNLRAVTEAERKAWFETHGRKYPVLVAEYASQVVGWGALSPYSPREGYRFTVEDSLYVAPHHHGKGLGKMLLSALLHEAATRGYHAVIALIESGNTASIHLHQHLGFCKIGTLSEVGRKFGRWLDVSIMQKLLDPVTVFKTEGFGY